MLLFIFSFLGLLSFSTPDEKELRQLHHLAEYAMSKKDFKEAKDSYEKLLEKVIEPASLKKQKVDWRGFIDLHLRLASVYLELGEYQTGIDLLKKLESSCQIPQEFISPVQIMQGRLLAANKEPGPAFLLIKQAEKSFSVDQWNGDDRLFSHSLEYMLDKHYDELLLKAKRLFTVERYLDAKKTYEELLEASEKGYYPRAFGEHSFLRQKIRCRLAEANFHLKDYTTSLKLLGDNEHFADKIDTQAIYLTALCYQEQKEYQKALEKFSAYLSSGERRELAHYEYALFEMGYAFFKMKNYPLARYYFETLLQPGLKPERPIALATIYLSRLELQEHQYKKAESLLRSLKEKLLKSDPLQYEISYLRGVSAFESGENSIAIELFEKCFPTPPISGEWTYEATLKLGWCYALLAKELQGAQKQQEVYFSNAEMNLKKLLKTNEFERSAVALLQVYLFMIGQNCGRDIYSKMESLIENLLPKLSLEAKLHSYLIVAEACKEISRKKELYELALDTQFANCSYYSEALLRKGLFSFQEALKTNPPNVEDLSEAVNCFENAYRKIEKTDPLKAVEMLRWEAQAFSYFDSPAIALQPIEKLLLNSHLTVQEREELFYLKGLVAERSKNYMLAEESLQKAIGCNGAKAQECLFALGMLYFRKAQYQDAEDYFSTLASRYPDSPFAAEGWFWAGEAAEKRGTDHKKYRELVIENYPDSQKADEAFFRIIHSDEYTKGTKESLAHLSAFIQRFPFSRFATIAYYFLGKHEKDANRSSDYYQKGLEAFEYYKQTNPLIESSFLHFNFRTKIEFALLKKQSDQMQSIQTFSSIMQEFEEHWDKTHAVLNTPPISPLYEEAAYLLALVCLEVGKNLQAQSIFSKLLQQYSAVGLNKGFYLSRIWLEQGKLAAMQGDDDTALKCYEMAELSGQETLVDEEKHLLWFLESKSLKEKKQYSLAMRKLSKIVNDPVSPLKMEAMYLRAELYELQGRKELSWKQLEATAKKGGYWGELAREKLQKEGWR